MIKKTVPALLLLLALASAAPAQTAREAVSALPESQAVLVVNARRITNEALPRVLPPKQRADVDKVIADLMRQVNVDLRSVEYAVVGLRFGDALADGRVPDFGVALRGGFNADALLTLARLAMSQQHRPEQHGGKTLDIYKMDFGGKKDDAADPNAPPPPAPPVKLPTEIAFVSFGADELMVGTPAYVRAAVSARGGEAARVSAQLAELALRNPEALVSVAGDLPPGLSGLLNIMDKVPANQSAKVDVMNDEIKRLVDSVRQVQFSLNMGAADFGVQTVLRTERPEDARAISGLAAMGLTQVADQMEKEAAGAKTAKDRAEAQKIIGVLRSVGTDVSGNEVTFRLAAPQATVADLVRDATAPKQMVKAVPKRRATPPRGRVIKRRD